MRVLIIGGDNDLAFSLQTALMHQECNVFLAELGEEGIEMARFEEHDAIVIDAGILDGIETIKAIRRAAVKAPILLLSPMAEVADIARAIDLGADDYLTKPAHQLELLARLHGLVRRSRGFPESIVTTGNLTVNLSKKMVQVNGEPLHVTGKEYQMLELLALRKGAVQTKEAFLNHLYGGMDEPEMKIVDVFICKLRKKLKAAGSHPVETVWGRGYILQDHKPEPVDMSSEVRSLVDEPPTGFVSQTTFSSRKRAEVSA